MKDEFGGADVNDVLALFPIIDDIPQADSERIAMWGTSRGGMMSLLAARHTDRLDALILEAAPTDLAAGSKRRPEMEQVCRTWIPGYEENPEAVLKARSALEWVDELPADLPMLIMHGTEDWRVSPEDSLRLALALQQRDRPYQLMVFEGAGHGLHRTHGREAHEATIAWLEKTLESTGSKQE